MNYTGPYPHTNTGTITAMVVSSTTFSGNVANSGSINPGGIAVSGSELFGNIVDSGFILGSIAIAGSTIDGNIQVTGLIVGGISTDSQSRMDAASENEAGVVIHTSRFAGGITNGGTISGVSGIVVSNVSIFGGGISNSGTVSSKSSAIVVNTTSTFSGGINNTGTITAGSVAVVVSAVSAFSGGITNTGTISAAGGGIFVSTAGSVHVFDSGTIQTKTNTDYAIHLTGGTNTVTLAAGYSINGKVQGAGSDTLEFGTGFIVDFDLSAIGTQYTGFSNYDVTGSAWDVVGTLNQAAPWSVAGGANLNLVDGASLTTTGGSNAGELAVVRGSSLTINGTYVNTLEISVGSLSSLPLSTIKVNGTVTGGGVFNVNTGGVVEVASGASISGEVFFSFGGTLQLDSLPSQVGSVGFFGAGGSGSILFSSLAWSSLYTLLWTPNSNGLGGTIAVRLGASVLASLNVNNTYSVANFHLSNVNNKTEVTYTANSAVPAGTSEVMLMDQGGTYYIYDIGHNSLLNAYELTQTTSQWQVAGLGDFSGTDTADMMMRNSSTGAFDIYGMSNNNINFVSSLGQVGLEWSVAGFADFSGNANETDMLLRKTSTGEFQLYDIRNGQFTGFPTMGQVGPEWSVAGFGDFSGHAGETDMMMRNMNTGAFELYDIVNNAYTGFFSMGQVGLEWSVVGLGNFSGNANESDMIMRNKNTGAFEIYDIANNNYAGFFSMGQVGLEWSVVGFGDFSGNANESDMLMRNTQTGAFELYDIVHNNYAGFYSMGQVGPEWSVAAVGADPPGGSSGTSSAQMAQAIASFTSNGAAATTVSGTTPTEPSQQALLTVPQQG